MPARHVRDRIFQLSPVHTSVIYQISLNSMKGLLHIRKTPIFPLRSVGLPTLGTVIVLFLSSVGKQVMTSTYPLIPID